MKKLFFYSSMLLAAVSFGLTSCTSDDDNESTTVVISDVPSDDVAGDAPEVTTSTVVLPNISEPMLEGNGAVIRISMTGVKATKGFDQGTYLHLYGTGEANQNVWLTIDGKPKSVKVINSEDVQNTTKGMADVVFLIDDSGSMGEEADTIAKQVVEWSQVLARTLDCRFGVVGYGDGDFHYAHGEYGIDGGMDLNVIDSLDYFGAVQFFRG